MSDDTDLNPQEPGAQPQADPMADLAQQTVATIVGELDALTTEQLAALYGIEKSGDGRKGVLAAIEKAQAERAEVEPPPPAKVRSDEHTSELQHLMRKSYAVFCLKTKNTQHVQD